MIYLVTLSVPRLLLWLMGSVVSGCPSPMVLSVLLKRLMMRPGRKRDHENGNRRGTLRRACPRRSNCMVDLQSGVCRERILHFCVPRKAALFTAAVESGSLLEELQARPIARRG